MENKKKLGTGAFAALVVIAVLNVLWLASRIILFSASILSKTLIPIGMLVITVFYIVYGYKKPHGNHMRYLLLIYVVYEGIILMRSAAWQPTYVKAANLAIVVLATYMAGRLDRYKQNVIISAIILVLHLVYIYPFINMALLNNTLTAIKFVGYIGPVTIWLAIAASYIIRFKEHKEAGSADK